jgi:plasmid stabilization system protein ParE
MARVRWSAAALRDLDGISRFLRGISTAYAFRIGRKLIAASSELEKMPLMGRMLPEVESPHIRELLRENYRIVYAVSETDIEILAVLHSRQDLEKKLRRE